MTREVCLHVLGWPATESHIVKTRQRIMDWLRRGIVERAQTQRMILTGHTSTQMGFRLIGLNDKQEEAAQSD